MMAPSAVPLGSYTHRPELQRNPLLGSLQLVGWLFFHPSAWRNHVGRIDSSLRPEFVLTELSRARAAIPEMRRLLAYGYGLLAVVVGLLFGVTLWVSIGLGVNHQTTYWHGSTPTPLEPISSPLVIALIGLSVGSAGGVALRAAGGASVLALLSGVGVGTLALPATPSLSAALGLAAATAFGVGSWVVADLARPRLDRSLGSSVREFAGVVAGLFIGIVSGLIGYGFFWAVWRVLSSVGLPDVALSALAGVWLGLMTSLAIAAGHAFGDRLSNSWAGGVGGALGGGLAWGLSTLVVFPGYGNTSNLGVGVQFIVCLTILPFALTLTFWRALALYPLVQVWNIVLLGADTLQSTARPRLLPWHSAFWDEFQILRLVLLDRHLALLLDRNPQDASIAIEYLADSPQHWAIREARVESTLRRLGQCTNIEAVSHVHRAKAIAEFEGRVGAHIARFLQISRDIEAALQLHHAFNQRQALGSVEERLGFLLWELSRTKPPKAARMRAIGTRWRRVVADQVQALSESVEQRQEIDSPYIIGVPLTEEQEIFVGRTDTSARIEGLVLDRRRPPILLYGQRRMGKTSLLYNLSRLLPSTIVPLFVDLQGPATRASDHAGFLYNVARAMVTEAARRRGLTLPPLEREQLLADPFTRFDEWLDQVEGALGGGTALLALDEFEVLNKALSDGRFNADALLGMLRHVIQHRPRFKVLLAGSHTLEELQQWSSYLINVQVVHLGYLSEDEARQLVGRPVADFALSYEPEAIRRVLELTRCHPFLVQLLCAEIVSLKNEQDPALRRVARLVDVEDAAPAAMTSGSFFFADIERNQIDAAARSLLRGLAAEGEGGKLDHDALQRHVGDELDTTLDTLRKRELVEPVGTAYRFQVELVRRWFAREAT
jgi:hypothetical protein